MKHNLLDAWRAYVRDNFREEDEAILTRRFLSSLDPELVGDDRQEARLLHQALTSSERS